MSRIANYREARAQIALEALSVPVEQTITTMCPVCNGGDRQERKLSVTRMHGSALFCCFRASCGFRGFVDIGDSGTKGNAPKAKSKPARPYTEHISTNYIFLRSWQYKGFVGLAQLPFMLGLGFSSDGKTQVYACRGFQGELLGHVSRYPDKTIKTFRAREGTDMYSVYRVDLFSRKFVLVEDCVSAMAVASHGYNSIALLGTNVPPAVRARLRFEDRCAVFLDPDAESKALQMAESLGGIAIIGYGKDPKDLANLGETLKEHV